MSHHSEYPGLDPETAKLVEGRQKEIDGAFKKMLKESTGATGFFPDGKLAPHDEGEIAFVVGTRAGKVVIEFGKEIASLGMTAQQAVEMAESLLKYAKHVTNDILTMKIG